MEWLLKFLNYNARFASRKKLCKDNCAIYFFCDYDFFPFSKAYGCVTPFAMKILICLLSIILCTNLHSVEVIRSKLQSPVKKIILEINKGDFADFSQIWELILKHKVKLNKILSKKHAALLKESYVNNAFLYSNDIKLKLNILQNAHFDLYASSVSNTLGFLNKPLLSFLDEWNDVDFAFELIQNEKFNPNHLQNFDIKNETILKIIINHKNFNPNIQFPMKWSLCMKAMELKLSDVVLALLDHPAFDPNIRCDIGWTALSFAISQKNWQWVTKLINHPRINLSYIDSNGESYQSLANKYQLNDLIPMLYKITETDLWLQYENLKDSAGLHLMIANEIYTIPDCSICFEKQNTCIRFVRPCLGHQERDFSICVGCHEDLFNHILDTVGLTPPKCPVANCQHSISPSFFLARRKLSLFQLTGFPRHSLNKIRKLNELRKIKNTPNAFPCLTPECYGHSIVLPNQVMWLDCKICKKSSLIQGRNITKEHNVEEFMYNHELGSNPNFKACPKCGEKINKNGGCDHMTCKICKYEWYWSTGLPYRR